MDGKFNEEGALEIKRAGRWKEQKCFYQCVEYDVACGEHCPQVSEPIRQRNDKMERSETIVYICQNRHWKFTSFEDRRTP